MSSQAWVRSTDADNLRQRLNLAHKTARQASEHAGQLLLKIEALEKQVAMRDRVIAALRQEIGEGQG
jgi:hypothetical protein